METKQVAEKDITALIHKATKLVEEVNHLRKTKEKEAEKWLDNQDVCLYLKVSIKTLQSYRERGAIPFSQIGSKHYYKKSDVEKFINRSKNK